MANPDGQPLRGLKPDHYRRSGLKDAVSHHLSPPGPLTSTAPQAFPNNLTMPCRAAPCLFAHATQTRSRRPTTVVMTRQGRPQRSTAFFGPACMRHSSLWHFQSCCRCHVVPVRSPSPTRTNTTSLLAASCPSRSDVLAALGITFRPGSGSRLRRGPIRSRNNYSLLGFPYARQESGGPRKTATILCLLQDIRPCPKGTRALST